MFQYWIVWTINAVFMLHKNLTFNDGNLNDIYSTHLLNGKRRVAYIPMSVNNITCAQFKYELQIQS